MGLSCGLATWGGCSSLRVAFIASLQVRNEPTRRDAMNTESLFRSQVSERQNSCSKTNFKSIAIISSANDAMRRVFLVVLIGLMVACALVLTGCGRASGEFPNIPELMDECQSWSAEEFASKMNLELNVALNGGNNALGAREAKDLSQLTDEDVVFMWLLEGDGIVTVGMQADFEGAYYALNDVYTAQKEFKRYRYDYKKAIDLLETFGIRENSIKVYDDQSSSGVHTESSQYSALYYWGSEYDMCGETTTEKGEPLFFWLRAQAGFRASSSDNAPEPFDEVWIKFSTLEPYSLPEKWYR